MSAYKNFSNITKQRAKKIIDELIKYHFNIWERPAIKGLNTEILVRKNQKGCFTYLLVKTTTHLLHKYINLYMEEQISDKTLKILINRLEDLSFIKRYHDKKNVTVRVFEVQIENQEKFNFQRNLAAFDIEWNYRKEAYLKQIENRLFDLQSAPKFNSLNILGRSEEQQKIKELILNKGCKLVAITGEGGIGKTTLALKVAYDSDIRNYFKYIIWRSLLNAPPITTILSNIVGIISDHNEIKFRRDLDDQINLLLVFGFPLLLKPFFVRQQQKIEIGI